MLGHTRTVRSEQREAAQWAQGKSEPPGARWRVAPCSRAGAKARAASRRPPCSFPSLAAHKRKRNKPLGWLQPHLAEVPPCCSSLSLLFSPRDVGSLQL